MDNDMQRLLEIRRVHDKDHRAKHNVPPAFCPLCQEKLTEQEKSGAKRLTEQLKPK